MEPSKRGWPLTPERGNKVPDAPAARLLCGESVLQEGGNKDHRPLHPFGLVDRHDADSIRVRVLVVLPPLWIGVLRPILKEVGERRVLFRRLRVKVNCLEIRDELAELAEIVEDDLASTVGHGAPPVGRAASRKSRNTRCTV